MSKENYGVHIAHCCYIHGCKYGDENCPVASGEVTQKHLCCDCEEEYEPYTLEEIELLRKTKSYRPTYKQLKDKVADLEAKLEELREQITICDEENSKTFMKSVTAWRENAELKQQLAEKERLLRKYAATSCPIHQDKISFAVEQLINTKGRMQHCILFNSSEDYLNVIQQIDNQIKQLKEGK